MHLPSPLAVVIVLISLAVGKFFVSCISEWVKQVRIMANEESDLITRLLTTKAETPERVQVANDVPERKAA